MNETSNNLVPNTATPIMNYVFQGRALRVIDRNGQPWFVAADLASILGYATAKDAIRLLDDDEKDGHNLPTPGGEQRVSIVSESGLYNLVMKSRRLEARDFRRWVTGDVLPTIRQTGGYIIPTREVSPAQLALQMAQTLVSLEARTENLEKRLDETPIMGRRKGCIRSLCQQLGHAIGNYSRAYRLLHERFGIASYADLPNAEYANAIKFLQHQIAAYTDKPLLQTADAISESRCEYAVPRV
jgi:prophage antirepressor-like protein